VGGVLQQDGAVGAWVEEVGEVVRVADPFEDVEAAQVVTAADVVDARPGVALEFLDGEARQGVDQGLAVGEGGGPEALAAPLGGRDARTAEGRGDLEGERRLAGARPTQDEETHRRHSLEPIHQHGLRAALKRFLTGSNSATMAKTMCPSGMKEAEVS